MIIFCSLSIAGTERSSDIYASLAHLIPEQLCENYCTAELLMTIDSFLCTVFIGDSFFIVV